MTILSSNTPPQIEGGNENYNRSLERDYNRNTTLNSIGKKNFNSIGMAQITLDFIECAGNTACGWAMTVVQQRSKLKLVINEQWIDNPNDGL